MCEEDCDVSRKDEGFRTQGCSGSQTQKAREGEQSPFSHHSAPLGHLLVDRTPSLGLQIAVSTKDGTPFLLVLIFCTERWQEVDDKQIKKHKCQEVMHVAHSSAPTAWPGPLLRSWKSKASLFCYLISLFYTLANGGESMVTHPFHLGWSDFSGNLQPWMGDDSSDFLQVLYYEVTATVLVLICSNFNARPSLGV